METDPTIVGIRSGHLALKSRSCHIQMLAVSVGEALLFTLMVNQLWETGRRKRVAGALHSVSEEPYSMCRTVMTFSRERGVSQD